MGWFDRLFKPKSNSLDVQRNNTMLSTHDAFSVPTTLPFYRPAYPGRDDVATPDLEAATGSYAYPPPTSSPGYGHVPTSSGKTPTSSRQSTLLPLHMNGMGSNLPPYPSLAQTWNRIRAWLSREYPELGDTLNWGILPLELAEAEMTIGMALPLVVRESYLQVDGQEAESAAGCSEGLFFGLHFLPLSNVVEEWTFWREVDEDPATGGSSKLKESMQSIPPGWVRREYSQRGWIPLVTDKAGNYLGIDMNPGEDGSVGQVIVFGRDFDTKVVMWRGDGPTGWAQWLLSFVEELESGEGFELGASNESEGSEDSVGYESYFYEGGGKGDGEGSGGLHLVGEYRGWSVLEAWADRSTKHWKQAGLLPDQAPEAATPTNRDGSRKGLGVYDLASPVDSAAVVPIPVLSEGGPSQPSGSSSGAKTPKGPPTISITKPPAPQPVSLPSMADIMVVEDSPTSFDVDLEKGTEVGMSVRSGHPLAMADVRVQLTSPSPPPVEKEFPIPEEPMLVSLPSDESGSSTFVTEQISPSGSDATKFVPDLLQGDAEESPVIDVMKTSGSPLTKPQPLVQQLDIISPDAKESEDELPLSEPSIRLVSGDGVSGLISDFVDAPDDLTKELEADMATSRLPLSPTTLRDSSSSKTGKHEKKASIVSLKKFVIGGAKQNTVKDIQT